MNNYIIDAEKEQNHKVMRRGFCIHCYTKINTDLSKEGDSSRFYFSLFLNCPICGNLIKMEEI